MSRPPAHLRAAGQAVPRLAFELEEQVIEGVGQAVLMSARGEIDFAAGPTLRERLFAHVGGARVLVLDLSAVTFIDSVAIGVLVSAATRMGEIGAGTLSVVCSSDNERVMRIFDIAGVASLIALHRTVRDALSISSPPAGEQRPGPIVQACEAPGAAPASAPLGLARQYLPKQAPGQGAPDASRDSSGRQVDELA